MSFSNPFPENCCFAVNKTSLDLAVVHPREIDIGNTFLSSNRRAEFFTGRRCAHIAMREAGYPNLPIFRDNDRAPIWPLSMIGSISHGAGIAAAIISKHRSSLLGIGIDIEDLSRDIRTNIARHTLTEWEIEKWTNSKAEMTREVRIIFSIKETIYKCFYPIDRIYLGFHDAEVLELSDTGFKARLTKSPFPDLIDEPFEIQGAVAIDKDTVLSALQVKREQFFN